MRSAHGAVAPSGRVKANADRTNGGAFDRLFRGELRQQARESLRKHGLAAAGRADHQCRVTTSRSHLQRPLGKGLPADFGKIAGWILSMNRNLVLDPHQA